MVTAISQVTGTSARPSLRLATTLLRSHRVGTVVCHFRHDGLEDEEDEDVCGGGKNGDGDDIAAADRRYDAVDDVNADGIGLEDRPAKPIS